MVNLPEQIRALHQHSEDLEKRLGEVCGQYVEITAALAPFLSRYRNEVIRYHKALILLQRELADVRAFLGDTKAKHHGEAASPLDEFLKREDVSVQDQYERVWHGKETVPRREGVEVAQPADEELQALYGKAVARLHPDLAHSLKERRGRISLFNQVNSAYLRRDMETIRIAKGAADPLSNLPAVLDDKTVKDMRDRVYALEELIAKIEASYYDFRYGDVAKVRAYTTQAEAQGRDFIADLSSELQMALRSTAEELARLKKDIEQT